MARRAACALALGLWAAPAEAEPPSVRLWDGAVVLSPYGLFQLDMGTTFAHSRNGGPGAGVNLRRARLGVEAEILKDVEATFIWEFGSTPDSPDRLYQASVAYKGVEPFTATVGVFKPQFSLERMQGSGDLLFLERASIVSVAAGMAAGSARVGAELQANGDRWLAAAALTGSRTGPGEDSGQRGVTARLTGVPVQAGGLLLHLGLSGAISYRPPREDGARRISLSNPPELALDKVDSPLDTGSIRARTARTGGVEAGLGWGRLWVQGEYYGIAVDRAGPRNGTLEFSGWYAQAAWTVLGQPRQYKPSEAVWSAPKPDEGGFNPAAGRWGAVEVAGRFSTIDLNDAEVRGGRQSVWTAGVGWVPVDPLRFVLQYQNTTVRGGADDRRFQAVALRAQLQF